MYKRRWSMRALSGGAVALVAAALLTVVGAGTAGAATGASACSSGATTISCGWVAPGRYEWVAPAGVTQVNVDVFGAKGGDGCCGTDAIGPGGFGGEGDRVKATIDVVPGHQYIIDVGGNGTLAGTGGYNGGGASGDSRSASGGGASDVRTGTDPSTRIVVAGGGGGGGGGGSNCIAGLSGCAEFDLLSGGGGGAGSSGYAGQGCPNVDPAGGGLGGSFPSSPPTGGAGGAGGQAASYAVAGGAGGAATETTGGAGGQPTADGSGGGGGGGGYGGGGGGGGSAGGAPTNSRSACDAGGGGGGAGASHVDRSVLAKGTTPSIVRNAASSGAVFITYAIVVVTPSPARVGQLVEMSGVGYQAGEPVKVSLDSVLLDIATARSDGQFHTFVHVPAATAGPHTVTAVGSTSGHTLGVALQVQALVVSHPAAQGAGSAADAGVFGFPAGVATSLHWDGANGPLLGSGTTDPLGSLTLPFTVPAGAAAGAHKLFAVTGVGSASAYFMVRSTPVPVPGPVQPSSAAPGGTVLLQSTGFSPGQSVPVSVGGTLLAVPVADPSGAVVTTVVVPPSTAGELPVDMDGHVVALTVIPVLGLVPVSGPPGTVTAAAVFGFPANDTLTLHWGGVSGASVGSVTTNALGQGHAGLTTSPTASPGVYTVVATDANGVKATANMTLTRPASQVTLQASADPSIVGASVTYTAAVTAAAPSGGTPTGTVSFTQAEGGSSSPVAACQSLPLDNTGHAQCAITYTTATSPGSFTVTAAYSGDSRFTASTSAGLTHDVEYGIKLLYDPSTAFPSAKPVPLSLDITDASGTNLAPFSSDFYVTAECVAFPNLQTSCGSAPALGQFTYDNNNRSFGFTIPAADIPGAGTWKLLFKIKGDPILHAAEFTVK